MDAPKKRGSAATPAPGASADQLAAQMARLGPREAAELITQLDDSLALEVLRRVNPALVADLLPEIPEGRRAALLLHGPQVLTAQWSLNQTFDEGTVGRLMEPPSAVFGPEDTVAAATIAVRELVKKIFVSYCFVCDADRRLVGIVTMRDLLVSSPSARLADIMLPQPFCLRPETPLMVAMKQVLNRHYPVYPMCDGDNRLIGVVRGQAMFEQQAYEISAQAGAMVGVDKEERMSTSWSRSFRFRHPWLQLNLATAFLAAYVVGMFQGTIDRIIILAAFLPVLAGQSGNTGCQALAVTLRGMTLGELQPGQESERVGREAWLGFLNGALVGLTAGLGMYVTALVQHNPNALMLAAIVVMAMVGACTVSGIAGVVIPLTLRRMGFDPATASSIFLTTATDVVSMGTFLGLATLLLIK